MSQLVTSIISVRMVGDAVLIDFVGVSLQMSQGLARQLGYKLNAMFGVKGASDSDEAPDETPPAEAK